MARPYPHYVSKKIHVPVAQRRQSTCSRRLDMWNTAEKDVAVAHIEAGTGK
jgi:hypothetical protein